MECQFCGMPLGCEKNLSHAACDSIVLLCDGIGAAGGVGAPQGSRREPSGALGDSSHVRSIALFWLPLGWSTSGEIEFGKKVTRGGGAGSSTRRILTEVAPNPWNRAPDSVQ